MKSKITGESKRARPVMTTTRKLPNAVVNSQAAVTTDFIDTGAFVWMRGKRLAKSLTNELSKASEIDIKHTSE